MRSVNLISASDVDLREWLRWLENKVERAWLARSDSLAKREGHPEGRYNCLTAVDGDCRAYLMDRPTTRNEYDPVDLASLDSQIPNARTFVSVDYSNVEILKKVLEALRLNDPQGGLWVETEEDLRAPIQEWSRIVR